MNNPPSNTQADASSTEPKEDETSLQTGGTASSSNEFGHPEGASDRNTVEPIMWSQYHAYRKRVAGTNYVQFYFEIRDAKFDFMNASTSQIKTMSFDALVKAVGALSNRYYHTNMGYLIVPNCRDFLAQYKTAESMPGMGKMSDFSMCIVACCAQRKCQTAIENT
jgi:hypothetical protein